MTSEEKLKAFFGATQIAGSEVTEREATRDRSVTVTESEKEVLFSCYGLGLFTRAGGAVPDGKAAEHVFNVLNYDSKTVEQHALPIKYPKATGNELRLYFKQDKFQPPVNSYWYIFTRAGNTVPFLVHLSEDAYQAFQDFPVYQANIVEDSDDEDYQKNIHSPLAKAEKVYSGVARYPRSLTLALDALESASYSCEYDESHLTFTAAASANPYMEVHHLVPMSKSEHFEVSLDVLANLTSLCPNCHRAVHHGTPETKAAYLSALYAKRADMLRQAGIEITLEGLFELYGAG